MIEVSLFGFLASGAFLGLANFDLFYQLVAMVIILKILYQDEMQPAPLVSGIKRSLPRSWRTLS